MKLRPISALIALFLIAVFGFGLFLLIAAEEMPVPGLIVMLISGIVLLIHLMGRPNVRASHTSSENPFTGLDQARESHEYELERHRRGDFDVDVQTSRH